jgi:hypothetical protein
VDDEQVFAGTDVLGEVYLVGKISEMASAVNVYPVHIYRYGIPVVEIKTDVFNCKMVYVSKLYAIHYGVFIGNIADGHKRYSVKSHYSSAVKIIVI